MESVQVEIFGQVYTIKGQEDPAYIRELAAFVDTKMKEVQSATRTAEPHRVAILTALTISDELFRMRRDSQALETKAGQALERLLHITDTRDPRAR